MAEKIVNITQIEAQATRDINDIIIHCAATYPTMDVGAAEIRRIHVEENGWRDIGYHYVVRRNGVIEKGREDTVVGAHCKDHNSRSIGICLVGGLNKTPLGKTVSAANYTDQQYKSLELLVLALRELYPAARIHGHSDYANKACPCFDVSKWWAQATAEQR